MTKTRRGLSATIQRDPTSGLAEGTDAALDEARVLHLISTRGNTPIGPGEMPWRPAFGVGLDIARHRPNNPALPVLIGSSIQAGFKRWLPDLTLVDVRTERDGTTLRVTVVWRRPDERLPRSTTAPVS